MEFTHEKFGRMAVADFTQAQMEAYGAAMVNKEAESMPVYFGACVKTAIKNGMLVEPVMTDEEVAASKPAYVKWLALNILKAVSEANNIDPLS